MLVAVTRGRHRLVLQHQLTKKEVCVWEGVEECFPLSLASPCFCFVLRERFPAPFNYTHTQMYNKFSSLSSHLRLLLFLVLSQPVVVFVFYMSLLLLFGACMRLLLLSW